MTLNLQSSQTDNISSQKEMSSSLQEKNKIFIDAVGNVCKELHKSEINSTELARKAHNFIQKTLETYVKICIISMVGVWIIVKYGRLDFIQHKNN